MKHKEFRKDLEYIALMTMQLKSTGKDYQTEEITKKDVLRAIEKVASIIESKLEDIVKDVYADLIQKGEWLDRNNKELPI